MDRARVVSLFCGCGGLDAGFKAHDAFDLIYSCDNDPSAVDAYSRNIDERCYKRDVTDDQFHEEINGLGNCEVVLGGFPCQGFSKAGPKNQSDTRNALYVEMRRAVERLRPLVVIAENVDGVSQNFGGSYVARIIRDFEDIGYRLEHKILDVAAYGVPQHRRRILFVGTPIRGVDFNWPHPTHNAKSRNGEFKVSPYLPLFEGGSKALLSPLTICDAISDLLELNEFVPDHVVTNSWPAKYNAVFRAIDEGQKLCNVRHAPSSVYTWQIQEVFGKVTKQEVVILETIGKHRRHKKYGAIPNGNPLPADEIERLSGLINIASDISCLLKKGYLKKIDGKFDLKGAMFCSGIFKRPRWREPCPTILTNFHNPRYFIHSLRDRPFSLRECARLQGFEDTFEFCSDKVSLVDGYRLVGNAVPPPLSKFFADATWDFLERCWTRSRKHETSAW